MTRFEKELLLGTIVLGGLLGFLQVVGYLAAQEKYQREAIEHGAAHYHPETAESTWGGVDQ